MPVAATSLESPTLRGSNRQPEDAFMTVALRKASNTFIIAAQLYRELAVSASDLLRPSTYR
jgi:hypothetical protein